MMDKRAEKERKRIIERIKRDEEFKKMLNEIPQSSPYLNHHHTSFGRVSLPPSSTEHSSPSSSCFSNNGFCFSDDVSPFSTPFNIDDTSNKYRTATHFVNGGGLWLDSDSTDSSSHFMMKNNGCESRLDDELGLCENLYRMNIREEQQQQKDHHHHHHRSTKMKRFEMDPDGVGFGFGDGSLGGLGLSYNVDKYGTFDGLNNSVFDNQGFGASRSVVPMSFDDEMESVLIGLGAGSCGDGFDKGELKGSNFSYNQSNGLRYNNIRNYLLEQRKEQQGRSWSNRGFQVQNPSRIRPYRKGALLGSQQQQPYELDSDGEIGVMNHLSSTQLMHPELDLHLDNLLYNRSLLKERTSTMSNNNWVSQSPMSRNRDVGKDGFDFDDSFIIQEKSLNRVINKGRDSLRGGHKKNNLNQIASRNPLEKVSKLNTCVYNGGIYENDQGHLLPSSSSLAEVRDYIYLMAKDQNGCRFLQRVFDEGTYLDVQIIFNEVIDHVVELMMEQFGNYLVQKLLNVCNEEQRMQIVLMVTNEPGQLVRICLNTYGTRVVQKLIETLRTRQQISIVKSALKPGFLDLIKDLNGNHVLQRCLQCLSNEDNEFIFDAAAKYCVDIATHRHGCCVLQRCIAHSTGEHRNNLISEIASNGLLLAQDPFGNYVVQYIIELKIPSVVANLLCQFKGQYVHLSMQKFSSHVVEKCLKHFGESRSQIIHEFLSVSHFEQLLQDPYANYVIQSAMAVTKGPLHASLVEAVRPHTLLRTNPYCKRIFSRNMSKK